MSDSVTDPATTRGTGAEEAPRYTLIGTAAGVAARTNYSHHSDANGTHTTTSTSITFRLTNITDCKPPIADMAEELIVNVSSPNNEPGFEGIKIKVVGPLSGSTINADSVTLVASRYVIPSKTSNSNLGWILILGVFLVFFVCFMVWLGI